MSMVHELTEQNFDAIVMKSDKPVLVDFWASWCGPCRMVGPIVEDIAKDFDGKLVVGKVNVDEQGRIAEQYRVMSIPTLFIFKNGQAVNRLVGARPYEELAAAVQAQL